MTVRLVSVKDALARAEDGEIAHGVHLAALFWAERKGLLDLKNTDLEP